MDIKQQTLYETINVFKGIEAHEFSLLNKGTKNDVNGPILASMYAPGCTFVYTGYQRMDIRCIKGK